MNFKRYFISITVILCVFTTISFSNQRLKAVNISGGEQHTLVVSDANQVFVAGDNSFYQLGLGEQSPTSQFALVRMKKGQMNTSSVYLEHAIAVAAGWTHSLVLDSNHCVWAAGAKNTENGYLGQLGSGATDGSFTPVQVIAGEQNANYPNNPLKYITKISAGRSGEFSMAIDSNFCYAWGRNKEGQCGVGSTAQDHYYTPKKVLGVGGTGFLPYIISVSCGEQHAMALEKLDSNYPTTRKGRVYTWGDNEYQDNGDQYGRGKLGINNTTDAMKTTPQIVHAGQQNPSSPDSELINIVAISAGWDHCMALERYISGNSTYKGRVFCWGNNDDGYDGCGGRLGDGNDTGASSRPVLVKAGQQSPSHMYLEGIVAIGAGESHSMMLDCNGVVFCVGDNKHGQLGNGTFDPCAVPVKVVFPAGVKITKISAGYWHSLAVDTQNRLWTWGNGVNGKLANGSSADKNKPYLVPFYDPNVYNKTHPHYYTTIGDAITNASNGDEIFVYPGIYVELVRLDTKQLTLESSEPNDPSIVAQTIISWDGSPPVTVITNSTIKGFTIVNGNDGISCEGASPTISNCVIRDNGNGVLCTNSSSPTIRNCVISHNDNGIFGNSIGAATIRDNWIVENTSPDYITSFGIYMPSATGQVTIRNNTISKNKSGGIYVYSYYTEPDISNCIIWQNGYSNLSGIDTVNFCCIDNYSGNGQGNRIIDPCFVKASDGNYHLKSTSWSCINYGNPNTTLATNETDIDGDPRKSSGRVDIGADEYRIENFYDYVIFANAWLSRPGDSKWNSACDFSADQIVDYKDFGMFISHWLMSTGWNYSLVDGTLMAEPAFGEESGNEPPTSPPPPSPSIYLVYDSNITPEPNDEVTVYIHSDMPLYTMSMAIQVTGDANVIGAMNRYDCDQYGWDSGWWAQPQIDPNGKYIYISDIAPQDSNASGTVGYITLRYNSGQVYVAITSDSGANDPNEQPVIYSTDPIIIGGENMQGRSMMQNSVQVEQPVVDVNELANWAQQLWDNDPNVRAGCTESEWQDFINSIKSGQ